MRSLYLGLVLLLVGIPATASAQSCPSTEWDAVTLLDGSVPEGCPIELVVPSSTGAPAVTVAVDDLAGAVVEVTTEDSGGGPVNRIECDYRVCGPKTLPGGQFLVSRIRYTPPTTIATGSIVHVSGANQAAIDIPISAAGACPSPPTLPQGFSCITECEGCTHPGSEDDGCSAAGATSSAPPFALIGLATLLVAWRGRGARRARRARDRA